MERTQARPAFNGRPKPHNPSLSANAATTQLPGMRLTHYCDAGGTDSDTGSYCIEDAYADKKQ